MPECPTVSSSLRRTPLAFIALAENLDRVTETGGHTSVFLKILSGESTENVVRIRSAHKMVNNLPAGCKNTKPGTSTSFAEFQQKLRSQLPRTLVDATPGLSSFQLDPPMRSSLDWVRFSPGQARHVRCRR